MRKGLPAWIIKKYGVTKKAWQVFRSGRSQSTPSKVKTTTKRRNTNLVRKKNHVRRGSLTVPIAPAIGIVAALNAYGAFGSLRNGDITQYADAVGAGLTGFSIKNGNWDAGRLLHGAVPILVGIAAHKIAGLVGVNRLLARHKIPLIRV